LNPDANLEELEGPGWGGAGYPSALSERIHALGRMPLREFTEEDCRLILGQQLALGTLAPLAMDLLEADPFAEGDLYPGDLLVTLTRISSEFWASNPELRGRARRLLASAIAKLSDLDIEDQQGLRADLEAAYEHL
jgi:hypothetical protein